MLNVLCKLKLISVREFSFGTVNDLCHANSLPLHGANEYRPRL